MSSRKGGDAALSFFGVPARAAAVLRDGAILDHSITYSPLLVLLLQFMCRRV